MYSISHKKFTSQNKEQDKALYDIRYCARHAESDLDVLTSLDQHREYSTDSHRISCIQLSFGGMVLTIFALSILCAPEKKALDAG